MYFLDLSQLDKRKKVSLASWSPRKWTRQKVHEKKFLGPFEVNICHLVELSDPYISEDDTNWMNNVKVGRTN